MDELYEAFARAEATAAVSEELERLIRERRKVEAMTRGGLTHERPEQEAAEDLMAEIMPMLERIGDEIEKMLGGTGRRGTEGGKATDTAPPPASVSRPAATLAARRTELDRLLRPELERPGIVGTGPAVARVAGAAVGQGSEWQA